MRAKGIEPAPQVTEDASKKIDDLIKKRGSQGIGSRTVNSEGKVNG